MFAICLAKQEMRYTVVNLLSLLDEIGEPRTESLLSDFACPLSADVERFLRKKAIDFARQGWAQTHLIFTSFQKEPILVGYFTLALKVITVPTEGISKTVRKRIAKFATYNNLLKAYCLSAPLIAQLGKNFANSYNKLITGINNSHPFAERYVYCITDLLIDFGAYVLANADNIASRAIGVFNAHIDYATIVRLRIKCGMDFHSPLSKY
jgi:hypothetical protein